MSESPFFLMISNKGTINVWYNRLPKKAKELHHSISNDIMKNRFQMTVLRLFLGIIVLSSFLKFIFFRSTSVSEENKDLETKFKNYENSALLNPFNRTQLYVNDFSKFAFVTLMTGGGG